MLYDKIGASLDSSTIERMAAALARGDDAYSWERAANPFGVPVIPAPVADSKQDFLGDHLKAALWKCDATRHSYE